MLRFRNRYLLFLDVVLLTAVAAALYGLRFESVAAVPEVHRHAAKWFILTAVPLQVAVLVACGLYSRLWRFASVGELQLIFIAGLVAGLPTVIMGRVGLPALGMVAVPLGVLIPYVMLSIGIVALPRLALRIGVARGTGGAQVDRRHKRVLIAGAGSAGEMILRELQRNRQTGMLPVGFVDDDPEKWGNRLGGLPVLGPLSSIPTVCDEQQIEEILLAMPSAPGDVIRSVVQLASRHRIPTRIMPGLFEILSGRASVSTLREVRIEDLLRREPVTIDLAAITSLARDRTVLVTGAGGSIGAELCRQLFSFSPARLILLGHGENPIFEIQNELLAYAGTTEIIPVIADVRSKQRVREIIGRYRPNALFHAAAHKHVPLMEDNPSEAVTNNVIGTRNLVDACVELGVELFVMISTDKAVRPTNVMGATKRAAEYIVQDAASRGRGKFVSVRFGNVLGSQGSVVPTFLRQIQAGGPVTITHPEMRRYFMTIPEAVQLVLQAAAQGKGGELFMLDMGEPVKIVDLARDMIRLSGLQEGTDIEIKFTGARPGEKMFEELLFSHEIAEPTAHPKIVVSRNGHAASDIRARVDDLERLVTRPGIEGGEIRRALRAIVSDYNPDQSASTPEGSHAAIAAECAAFRPAPEQPSSSRHPLIVNLDVAS